jgi:hypothetical protein
MGYGTPLQSHADARIVNVFMAEDIARLDVVGETVGTNLVIHDASLDTIFSPVSSP